MTAQRKIRNRMVSSFHAQSLTATAGSIGGIVTTTDWNDLYWSETFRTGPANYVSYKKGLSPTERWLIRRIYADRVGPGKENPVDWGDINFEFSNHNDQIFYRAHLSDIGRPFGDLGDKIAKLLDECETPETLLQRLGAKPNAFISRVVGNLTRPILLNRGQELVIVIRGQLLQDIRLCFHGIRGLDVQ